MIVAIKLIMSCCMLLQGDDEQTIDEDEALITEAEREEELAALQNEADQPLEEILKSYMNNTGEYIHFCHVLKFLQRFLCVFFVYTMGTIFRDHDQFKHSQ